MQSSQVELCGLEQVVLVFKHAFLFIQQMALHLRNASLVKEKVGSSYYCLWIIYIKTSFQAFYDTRMLWLINKGNRNAYKDIISS